MNPIKFEMPFLAGALFVGADLMARVAVQGVEQAIFSTVVEWSTSRIGKVRLKFFSKSAVSSR